MYIAQHFILIIRNLHSKTFLKNIIKFRKRLKKYPADALTPNIYYVSRCEAKDNVETFWECSRVTRNEYILVLLGVVVVVVAAAEELNLRTRPSFDLRDDARQW